MHCVAGDSSRSKRFLTSSGRCGDCPEHPDDRRPERCRQLLRRGRTTHRQLLDPADSPDLPAEPTPATSDCVDDLNRVADGEDIRRRGVQVLVDDDRPAGIDGQSGGNSQCGLRPHSDRHQHQVGREYGSIRELDIDAVAGDRRIAVTDVAKCSRTPAPSNAASTLWAISGSRTGSTCEASSTIATSKPRCRNASATSTPMNPAPITTARRAPAAASLEAHRRQAPNEALVPAEGRCQQTAARWASLR